MPPDNPPPPPPPPPANAGPPKQEPPGDTGTFGQTDDLPKIPVSVVALTGALVFTCIVFAMVLCAIVIDCARSDQPNNITIRLLMSCIACFIAVAFASLGFGLFLLRAKGNFRARIENGAAGPAMLESTAPGLVVIVCATIVVWLALRVHFEETTTTHPSPPVPALTVDVRRTEPVPEGTTVQIVSPAPHLTDGVQPP